MGFIEDTKAREPVVRRWRSYNTKEESVLVTKKIGGWCIALRIGVWAIALGVWAIVGVAIFMNAKTGSQLFNGMAVVIASLAVAVSLWQGRIMRKHERTSREHARLSVIPYLDFSWHAHTSHALVLLNGGNGPALVTQVCVAAGDSPLEPATRRQWANVKEELPFGEFDTRTFVGKTVIPSNSEISVIKRLFGDHIDIVAREDEDTCQEKLRIMVVYESAYGESFETPIATLGRVPPANLGGGE